MAKVKVKNQEALTSTKEKLRGKVSFSRTKNGVVAKKWPQKKKGKSLYKKQKEKVGADLLKNQGVKDSATGKLFLTGSNAAEIKSVNSISSKKLYFLRDGVAIYKDDILKFDSIPNNSVDLIITSPPYNVDIHYNEHADNLSYEDYLEFTKKWIKRCFDLAKPEGRFLLNIPLNKNKGGQKSVGADITKIAKDIGWKYHSTIIWNEGNISRRTAWGSFMSASAPYVIAPVELILVLYKDSWKKTGSSRGNDITKQEFMDWTNGVWTFNGQSKKGAGGHPAPFPVELPRRCIKLFSFIGDTVLDPFLGSGSTLIAAYAHNRKGIGIDIDGKYCDIAIERLKNEVKLI